MDLSTGFPSKQPFNHNKFKNQEGLALPLNYFQFGGPSEKGHSIKMEQPMRILSVMIARHTVCIVNVRYLVDGMGKEATVKCRCLDL